MLKANSSEKCPKMANFDILGVWGQGVQKLSICSAKGTSLRESTSFESFSMKIGWGSHLQGGKKARKSQRLPIP